MKSQNPVLCIFVLIALASALAFITGCASQPPPDTAVVSQTLETYQVGKTTFADFKRDSRLRIVARPDPVPAAQQTYYYLLQPTWNPNLEMNYSVPNGSPWRIYGVQHYTNLMMRESSRTVRIVVGDIHHPISILVFGGNGSLISISDARTF